MPDTDPLNDENVIVVFDEAEANVVELESEYVVAIENNTGPVQVVELTGEVSTETVEIINIGPQGPPGPEGPPGSPGITPYIFTQNSPSSTWTINHNLGYKPSVELLNSGSQEIDGDVVHISLNQTVASFTIPVSGLARLI